MPKRKSWMKPLRVPRPEGPPPAGPIRRTRLVPALLALQFALMNGGAFILATAEVGSMTSLFHLKWAFHHFGDAKEVIILLGGGVFLASLGYLAGGVWKGTSGFEEDGWMVGFIHVAYLCASFGFLFACFLLSILVAAWLLAMVLPERAALLCGAILVGVIFALPFLPARNRRAA